MATATAVETGATTLLPAGKEPVDVCWSATADLVAGGVVAAVGVVTLAQVRRARDLTLAALPLILGMHQLIESVVWRGEQGDVAADVATTARTAWAAIALPLLPVLVPLGVLLAASPPVRRRLAATLMVGLVTAGALAYQLSTAAVAADIRGHTLGYTLDLTWAPVLIGGYLLATVGALLLGGDPVLRLLGVLMALGAVLCAVLWRMEFISTWCAFAAVVAVVLLRWVRGRPSPPPARHAG